MTFEHWVQVHWEALCAGKKIPISLLQSPETFGFKRLSLAEQNGQQEDWALPLADKSRLHLWVMPDGRHIIHRDRYDPNAGVVPMVQHFFSETTLGAFVGVCLLTVGAVRLLSASE